MLQHFYATWGVWYVFVELCIEELNMQTVKLIHNPTAGDEEHNKEHLVAQIEKAGFECRYSSTKKSGWKEIEEDIDILAVAGGDGTVRKVVKNILLVENNTEQIEGKIEGQTIVILTKYVRKQGA